MEKDNKKSDTKKLLKISIISGTVLLGLLMLFFYIYYQIEINNNYSKSENEKNSEITTLVRNSSQTNENTSHFHPIRSQLTNFKGNNKDSVTIMIYMNGSDLESEHGNATNDIAEMLAASSSDNVNIVIQTMGTKNWQKYNIASDHTQRFLVKDNELVLIDNDLEQLNCTEESTLSDFISYCKTNYPASRNILLFWNHGGGPVDGFGKNEWGRDTECLTLNEMTSAFESCDITFDIIGMDCCLMSSLETCYALYNYCDYTILSENFESSIGWYYTNFINALCENTSIDSYQLGKLIVDDMVSKNAEDSENGGSGTLALIDERYIPNLYRAWKNYAYANESDLLHSNYSRTVKKSSRAKVNSMENYYVTDIMALASSLYSEESKPLIAQLKKAIAYYDCTENCQGLTGMSITLPYNDRAYYYNLKKIFIECGFDKGYITWLYKFVTDANNAKQYSFTEFDETWNGWE